MASLRIATTGAAAAAAGFLLLSGAGAANAAATIPVPSGHTDLVEVECALDDNGIPEYAVGTHIEHDGIGHVPNGTSVLSDYVFVYDRSDSANPSAPPASFLTYAPITGTFGTWTSSGLAAAEDSIPAIGFHYEPESDLCDETITIDLQNAPGSSGRVSFTSNAPAPGFTSNGSTGTIAAGVVTLGNPLVSSSFAEHIHGTWTFSGSAAGQTYPLRFAVSIPSQGTSILSTAYLRVQQ